jgi:hypothetical protein
MKKIYSTLLVAASCLFAGTLNAQCGLSISSSAAVVCAGDNVTLTANATPPVTANAITSTLAGGNNHRGNMFDITAINTITITSFDAHPMGNTTIEIYYRASPYAGFTTSSAGWTLVGSAAVTAQPFGTATPVPVAVNVTIPAGQTYSFYVTSTNTAVSLNYTDGSSEGSPYVSDANLIFRQGVGMEYPFAAGGGIFTPRVWNGVVHYTVPVNATITYQWSTTATTQSINPTVSSTTQYTVQATVTGCPAMSDTVDVIVSVPPVNAGTDAAVCAGSQVTLLGSGAGSYSWNNGVNDGVAFIPSSTMSYIVTGTDSIGCVANDTVTVTVNTVNTTVNVLNETITAAAAGASYEWMDCSTLALIAGETGQSFTAIANGSYAVIVTENGCIDTSACEQIVSVGMEGISSDAYSVYPSPTAGMLTINTAGTVAKQVSIADVTGRIIIRIQPQQSQFSIDMEKFAAGAYYVHIEGENGTSIKKVIKQ